HRCSHHSAITPRHTLSQKAAIAGGIRSGAPIGNTNALRHGHYTAEAIARRRQLSELIKMARTTLAEIEERR
ncbi:MAG: hypothetical protein WCA23_27410, partial [Stellaceae bacterium]